MKIKISVLFLFLLCVSNSNAGIRPSFSLDYCSWNATDIVVATEGREIDGNFTVLESLKGDFYNGETISISELSSFQSESSRSINQTWINVEPLKYVTGSRMILFLKKKAGSKNVWEQANLFGKMNTSVVWLENDKSFAFVQVENPGASILIDYEKSESEIKNRILEILQTQNSFDSAKETKNKKRRAEEIEPFASSELVFVRQAAFAKLQQCGKDALPVLRKILKDESRLNIHREAIESLVKVGSESAGNELTAIVKDELDFWKATAPKLKKEWANDFDDPDIEILRNHTSRVYAALYELKILKFVDSKKVVTQLRHFWHSTPQLESKNGLSQITEECDDLLKNLPPESPEN